MVEERKGDYEVTQKGERRRQSTTKVKERKTEHKERMKDTKNERKIK